MISKRARGMGGVYVGKVREEVFGKRVVRDGSFRRGCSPLLRENNEK